MIKRLTILTAATALILALAAPAQAGILSGVLPGVLSPGDTPSSCDTSASTPFSQWGDSNYYVLVPGGSFEQGAHGWTLGGGAKIVSGNEPFFVHGAADRNSLYLPAGAAVTTPAMCFAAGDWHVRFFSKGSATIRVKVAVKSLLGLVTVLDGGSVGSTGVWRPSPNVGLLLTNVTGLVSTDSISLRISTDSAVRIDDVYLDPFKVA